MSAPSYTYLDHVNDHQQRLRRASTERLARSLRAPTSFRIPLTGTAVTRSQRGGSVRRPAPVARWLRPG